MSENQGFLDQLGLAGPDERAALQAARNAKYEGIAGHYRALGQQGQAALAGGAAAIGGLFKPREDTNDRSVKGFFNNLARGATSEVDRQAAMAVGIRPEQLAVRRDIRRELVKPEYTDDGTFGKRKQIAAKMYEIAKAGGDEEMMVRAQAMLDKLQVEEVEFGKLQAEKTKADVAALDAGLVNAWDSEGKVMTGELGRDENGDPGVWVHENGKRVFRPFGDDVTMYDPSKTKAADMQKPGWLARELKLNNNASTIAALKNKASSANQALQRTDRALSRLMDLFKGGMVQDVMGRSGTFASWVDNWSRDIRGVINAFGGGADVKAGTGGDGQPRTWNGVDGLKGFAADSGHWLSKLIVLPEGVEATSAAAQQHRAAVMEMAYMAARLAEPSNRGLSDNDIKNALVRIAGDTSNPQVMMRKFLEMQVDSYRELDYELSQFYGTMGPTISDEDIATALLGKGYPAYQRRKDELFAKFGVRETADGSVVFDNVIDVDVQPGSIGVQGGDEELDDDAFLESFQ